MSELMDQSVIGMPYEMAMGDELSRFQFYSRARAILDDRDHLRAEVEVLRRDAGRYQWLCEHFGVTKLPCAVERILAGDIYVADGKAGVDVAIDAAMSKESSAK